MGIKGDIVVIKRDIVDVKKDVAEVKGHVKRLELKVDNWMDRTGDRLVVVERELNI